MIFSLEMTALGPNDSFTSTFYVTFSNNIPNWASFEKEVFDPMFSLESEEMTVLWSNDASTFTFYVTISNSIPNWTTIVEELFDLMLRSETDKMTVVRPIDSKPLLFMFCSQKAYQTENFCKKKFLYSMNS